MKAKALTKEAPEKIYLTANEDGIHYYTEGIPFEREYTEYICKDTFIEKACEWLEKNIAEATGIDSYAITESFKQAMEK